MNYSGGVRVLNIDLQTLDPKEPIISQLFQAIEDDMKTHPEYADQNQFILGYLSMLTEKSEKAHDYFQKIPEDSPLHSAMLYFDGMTLREMGSSSRSKGSKEKNCKQSMENFEKVGLTAPSYFVESQPKELILSTFCYFEALVSGKKLDLQESQWFQNTLRSSSAWVESTNRENLYFEYLEQVEKNHSKDELVAYLEFGLSLFPKNTKLLAKASDQGLAIPATPEEKEAPIESTEQQAILMFNEAKNLLAKNEKQAALRKWMNVIVQFPGSYTGENAKREILSMIRTEVKWRRPTTDFHDDLKKLPPEMIFEIAKYLWNQDYNMTAYAMYAHLVESYPYFEKAPEAEYSIARMHEDWSEWSKAIQHYSNLVQKYSRSKYFERSHFKVGFLYYMNGEYAKAIEWLAKEKKLVTDPHQKAQANYWLARTYEKMGKKADAKALFLEIQKKFPLTYYSFILGIDSQTVKQDNTKIEPLVIEKTHPLYTPMVYLGTGLHKPARRMIFEYGGENDEHMYQIVRLFHDTGFHMFSMPNALSLSERKMEKYGIESDLLQMIFPVKYLEVVQKETSSRQTDSLIVLSLIKQESGYFERAVSNANAIGLMQLLVPTAQTLAKKINDPLPNKDDLFEPQKNIRLGVEYLIELNQQFNNDITLVLSAYNAGPERAAKWKNRWPNVRKDEFVELIPFSETRKYVKLILRNYSYYKFMVDKQNADIQQFGF